ncbi:cell surface protein, partial [Streptococcus pneumoniae]|nr:cell surface protein [Streptococcus pneumoniae]
DELDKEAEEAELDKKADELQNKVADLEKELSKLEDNLKDAEINNVEDYIKEGLEEAIATKQAELEKTQKELDAALNELGPDG